ncbi:hypothetical protein M413DRAFT_427692 [Hebeloma cylindrosporum]|uniref:F-box domain-containing protein n=1 Tax=Hebeloma cylindrosporum TaxID=76867 RepID=A0A0C3BHR4_HEBCY|nr:hypothetical protein M413DRAFT_427692 [Hebeloma cylindrosporum h7]
MNKASTQQHSSHPTWHQRRRREHRGKEPSSNSEPNRPGCVTVVSRGLAALSNEDILRLIFQEVDGLFLGEDLKKRNQSLLWAAQTSKAFFYPAVSVLWRLIRSLVPLLKILPQFKTSNTVHTLVGQISAKDWGRFEMYARSVRVLDLTILSETVGGDVYIQLARLHPDPLLPGLQRMNIPNVRDGSTDALAPLFHCITPTVSSVTMGILNGPQSALFATSFLSALSRDTVSLCDLSIDARIPSEAIDILLNLPSIRNLTLSVYSAVLQSMFAKLLCLPGVSSVSVNFSRTGSIERGQFVSVRKSPNKLKKIRVSGHANQIGKVMDTLQLFRFDIEEVDLFIQGPHYAGYFWHAGPSTLRHSKWEAGRCPNSIALPELRWRESSPIPSNVISLEVKGFRLRATNEDILKICKAGHWKNLEILHLPCFGSPDSISSPSIHILGELGVWCPKLRSLYICVDLSLHNHDELRNALLANIGARAPAHKLESLEISSTQSPKEDAFQQGLLLAQYIDSVFPHLKSLAAYGNKDLHYWDEIWQTVRCCQKWINCHRPGGQEASVTTA